MRRRRLVCAGQQLFRQCIKRTRIRTKIVYLKDRLGRRQVVLLQVVVETAAWCSKVWNASRDRDASARLRKRNATGSWFRSLMVGQSNKMPNACTMTMMRFTLPKRIASAIVSKVRDLPSNMAHFRTLWHDMTTFRSCARASSQVPHRSPALFLHWFKCHSTHAH